MRTNIQGTILCALVFFACVSCDHPYRPDADFVSAVDAGIGSVSVERYSVSADSSSYCTAGSVCVVSLDVINPRSLDISASVRRADESLSSDPVVLEAGKKRLSFSFTPGLAAAGKDIGFTVQISTNSGGRMFSPYALTVPCKAPAVVVQSYSVSYNANGGTGTLPASSGASFAAGSAVSIESGSGLSRSGFSFTGWNTSPDGSGTAYAAGSSLVITSNLTLYAQWKAVTKTYRVTYDANGGTGLVPASSGSAYAEGSAVGVEYGAGLSRAGYSFAGWNTAADGSGAAYMPGATLVASADVTLYAQWSAVIPKYTLRYDLNGGAGSVPASATVSSGTALAVSGGTGTNRAGFTFAGWNTSADGSGTVYAGGSTIVLSSDVTLYAQWSAVIPNYTVSYDANGGTGILPASSGSAYPSGTSVTAADGAGLSRLWFTFSGWNTAADGLGAAHAAGSTFVVSSNMTLYAQWAPVPNYTITYDFNGGTGTLPASSGSALPSGSGATVAGGASMSRAGFAFAGWNTAADGLGAAHAAGSTFVVSSNLTLYAQWTPLYTVSYNLNGGTGTLPASSGTAYLPGTSITVAGSAGISRAGYLFTGWNTAADGSGTDWNFGVTLVVSSDVTLYGQWVAAGTVTFDANGGAGMVSPVTVITGSDAVLPGGAGFSNSGQVFSGWNTLADGTGTAYAAGATMTVSANATLYAQWKNASLAACLAGISAGGSFIITGQLSSNDFADLRLAVFGAGAPVTLDLSGVSNISFSANLFASCAQLVSVTLPSGLLSLPQSCFQNCSSLTTLTLNASLQNLDMYCVKGCTALTQLTVPANVSVLAEGCFYQSGLAGNSGVITFEQSDTAQYYFSPDYLFGSTTSDIFGYGTSPANSATFTIRVPSSAETAYEALPLMSRYAAKIVGY
jgi:uncharacterized repeat protein (TIGR02543 family)